MADNDIQEQIDLFMEKMKNTKVPKKASGEAIVSKKPEKVKPEKKNYQEINHKAALSVLGKPKGEELGEIPFSSEENKAYYSEFLEQLVNIVGVLDETKVGPTPDQPISLYKVKGKWKAAVVPLQKEEPLALPPGPEEEKKPGNLVLTQPAKIRSPGGNEQASPPTFISLPTGKVTITKFIWTLPSEVPDDTECKVLVGYGAEQFILEGTFKSAGEALPFPIEKGGVLKVTLITTQPMEAWLELELEIEPSGFLMKLGTVLTPASPPLPLLTASPCEKPEEQDALLALAAEKKIAAEKELFEGITQCNDKNQVVKGYKPKITAVNINGKAVDVKELAEKFKSHLEKIGFTYYTIEGFDHEYKKTKGVLMNKKITWAGDPELNLVKWALTNGLIKASKSKGITIHDKKGISVSLLDTLVWLAAGIKPK